MPIHRPSCLPHTGKENNFDASYRGARGGGTLILIQSVPLFPSTHDFPCLLNSFWAIRYSHLLSVSLLHLLPFSGTPFPPCIFPSSSFHTCLVPPPSQSRPPPSAPPVPSSPEKTEDRVRSDETIKLVRAAVCVALQTRTCPHGSDPSSNGPNLYGIMQLYLYVLSVICNIVFLHVLS
jgi:hypothetical protein